MTLPIWKDKDEVIHSVYSGLALGPALCVLTCLL